MRTLIIAAAVLASTVAFIPARAEGVARVSYADLDLSTPTGAARLNRRVAGAVEQVCGSYATATRDQEDGVTACRKAAMASYRMQLAARSQPGVLLASR